MGKKPQTTGVLREDIQLLRGENLLLFDPAADSYYKISERTAEIISFFSEDLPLDSMLEKLRFNGILSNEAELLEICGFLRNNSLLIPRYGETTSRGEYLKKLKKKNSLLRLSSASLFFRLPPWRPENLFQKIGPYISFLTSRPMLLLWIIPAIAGYLLALHHSGRVLDEFFDSLSWMGLVKYALAIIIVKLIHEIAHSLAAIRFGCRVRGIGIGFIFFIPRLYTDTTDSWRLPGKQRFLIDCAGIIAELIIGGIAALCWNLLPPGSCRSTMFYLFTISTLSTLLVNGNIFIRYDGYYILCDLLGIENLMSRSAECVKRTWRWYFLRLGEPSAERKKFILILYGVLAFFYRIFLYTSICILIYYKFIKVFAVILLVLEIYTLLLYPLSREIKEIWSLSRKSAGIAVWFMLILLFSVIGCILFVPLSWGIRLPGESVPSEQYVIIAGESGYLQSAFSSLPKPVKKGAVILDLSSPQLEFATEKIQRTAEYDRTLYKLQELDEKEFAGIGATAQKIQSDQLALEELDRRRRTLKIVSDSDGYFVPSLPDLSAGAFVRRGTEIGKTVSRKNTVYAYALDHQVGNVYPGQKGTVTFSDSLQEIPCRVVKVSSVAAKLKGSPVLQTFGGPVPAYQESNTDFSPVQTLYCVELELLRETDLTAGRLVNVKLVHTERLYDNIRKLVVSFFRKEF